MKIQLPAIMMEADPNQEAALLEYNREYWLPLREKLYAFLHPRLQPTAISFEETFSLVYKCVGNGFSDRLFNDLNDTIMEHLRSIHKELLRYLTVEHTTNREEGAVQMVLTFEAVLSDYIKAVQSIAATFSYLEKYLIQKHATNSLREGLMKLFCSEVAEHFITDILNCVERSPSFTLDPAVLHKLFSNLQEISQNDYGQIYSQVFGRFVTHAMPRMREGDIEAHILEVTALAQTARLREQNHWNNGEPRIERNPALKRSADDS